MMMMMMIKKKLMISQEDPLDAFDQTKRIGFFSQIIHTYCLLMIRLKYLKYLTLP